MKKRQFSHKLFQVYSHSKKLVIAGEVKGSNETAERHKTSSAFATQHISQSGHRRERKPP